MYNKIFINYDQWFMDFNESLSAGQPDEVKFRNCHATVGETIDGEFLYLRSYDTIVFVYDKQTEEGFDILRTEYGFTATSDQHISKFIRDYNIPRVYRFDTEVRGTYYQRIK